ncbi:MAG: preprotein translocase subunit SecE [Oscillospiraceae bacterium]|nr:preprotein translocase subunit SecE [Oscillospiraceae bacterium]
MAEVKKDNLFKKIARYFRELKSELKKVVWSTPKQVAKNTLIVIACVVVVGLFIWVFDFVAQALITAIINLAH